MLKGNFAFTVFLMAIYNIGFTQNVPIQNYSVNSYGQVQLEIDASADKYYLLTARHDPNQTYESITSLTLGVDGSLLISEPLAAFPIQNYKVIGYSLTSPEDTDGDGKDDITEFNNMPSQAPLNFAREIPFEDGTPAVNTSEVFSDLAVINSDIPWAPFLNNQEFVKFAIVNQSSDEPEVYFINSQTHFIHAEFLNTINVDQYNDDVVTGEIVFNPNEILPNGAIGSYSFNYSFGFAYEFAHTQETFELLASNMPFLQNNLQHFIGGGGEEAYENNFKNGFEGSRINVVLESIVFADIDFIPFHQAEGYGFFKLMTLDENPGSRDVVLYESLPNSLPRVGGIMTSVVQTPLSHVNLRAIQDNLPNAYIKEPLEIDSIANLIGKYVYYKVEQESYTIREASLDEVNAWFEDLRPTVSQIPQRDLSQTKILPLDEIAFEMSTSFGAKCSNVATMRTFGFPEGTIPDGFGIPFYFYDEFMKFNDFYDKAESILNDPEFIVDLQVRIDMLKDFRKEIKDATMPQWMLDELELMHDSFPEGTSVRCRSSTNNEDLPGFSGAGLYTSKTQHPDEGHISKSVKQVYASMWNFRAYDERDFYRVDQFIAAMGILCHPNYDDEKSNGVGVSIDPIYQTENTFYLNTQVGEFLITNPDANSIPEELLLNKDPDEGFFVLRNSNLVPDGELVMGEEYLNLMRTYLGVIHDKFEVLYQVEGANGFGMDIEYKVTVDDRLIIKQARPWVSFWSEINANFDLGVESISNPVSSSTLGSLETVTAKIVNQGLNEISNFEISLLVDNEVVETISITDELLPQRAAEYSFNLPQDLSIIGDYNIGAIVSHPLDGYATNDTLTSIISKLHYLEGGINSELAELNCGTEITVKAIVSNYGEATFNETNIEVVSNGMVVDTINYDFNIPYLTEVEVLIIVTENIQLENNEIVLNLVEINGEQDEINTNNSTSILSSFDSNLDNITLIIHGDDYPQETTWALVDLSTNEVIEVGGIPPGESELVQDICVSYSSCFSLFVYDTYGDGICCGYGIGDFLVLDVAGDTLLTNNGDFGETAEEMFCLNGACAFSVELTTVNASDEDATDGVISIEVQNGNGTYEYSIDGGTTTVSDNVFENLSPGDYLVSVIDTLENCIHQEFIELGFDIINSLERLDETEINLFPNPTTGDFIIEIQEANVLIGNLEIEIYDNLGKLIHQDHISISIAESNRTISLSDYNSGSYLVRCYNSDIEKYFKVIKI